MALARILIDGYSLLHAWGELAPGQPPYSEIARDELMRRIRQYGDAEGVPITIVFDGARNMPRADTAASTPECEVVFSRAGQTADDLIERLVSPLLAYGEVLVVTDDHLERDTVFSLGGMAASCEQFILGVEAADRSLRQAVKRHNLKEKRRHELNAAPPRHKRIEKQPPDKV